MPTNRLLSFRCRTCDHVSLTWEERCVRLSDGRLVAACQLCQKSVVLPKPADLPEPVGAR